MASDMLPPPAIVVMGVSGSGKTTVGRELARLLEVPFVDADDLHSPANREKMAGGTPLTDDDRRPWLAEVGSAIERRRRDGRGVVVACSALRRSYRDVIRTNVSGTVEFAHLHGTPELLQRRLEARSDHFMPPALLASQLATLEALNEDETGAVFSIDESPAALATRIFVWLGAREGATA